ncbi:Protein of unknown function [Bacillus mycoides]|uniref:Uncharacterized protein n=1 Tax=Bacillus mycoides TaxID=1405 RepID=A0A1G4EU66_BACMY|nr:Protein of unknown function [Bacillus mycoides]
MNEVMSNKNDQINKIGTQIRLQNRFWVLVRSHSI